MADGLPRRLPVDFLLNNLLIQNNVIHASWKHGVRGLLFLGSSCIYPRLAPQPLREDYLLTGGLEPTNEPYAIAKIAGIELCEAFNRQYGTRFMSVMPANLYGPNDRYDLENSHVLPALIRKFHLAKLAAFGQWESIQADEALHGRIPEDIMAGLKDDPVVRLWGTGTPRREFLFSEDMAHACVFIMERLEGIFSAASSPRRHLMNIGCGADVTIRELAEMVARIVGFEGKVVWDANRPDGTPRKLLDVSVLEGFGWRSRTSLEDGIQKVYQDYAERPYLIKGKSFQNV